MNAKNLRRAIRRASFDRALRVIGGVVAIAGFLLAFGAVGSSDLEMMPLKETTPLALLGVFLLAAGAYMARAFDFQQPTRVINTDPITVNTLLGALAYSPEHRSWIMVVDYVNDNNWFYVTCSESGVPTSAPDRARANISVYDWVK